MKRLFVLLPCLALLALAGCVTVSESVLIRGLPPVHPDNIVIYFADDEVPEHKRVAVLVGRGHYAATTEGKMYDKLREEAGKLGANGVIVEEFREPSGTGKVVSAVLGVGGNRKGQAMAILVE